MQTGHFFKLDKNSFLHKGEVVFRYMRVKSDETQPLYPVYLSFKSHRIDFYFHGYLYNKKLDKNEFIETELFSLPLSTHETIVNELNNSLEEIHNSQFPFLFNYSLKKDISNWKSSFITENSEIQVKYLPEYSTKRLCALNSVFSYIQLDDFIINDQDVANAKSKKKKEYEGKKLLLRQLLLDFIFDIKHSEIFRACPYFNNAHQLLKENLFFEAISAKSNFCYWINKCKNQKDQPNLLELSKNELKKAKNRWIEIIQKAGADKAIKQKVNINNKKKGVINRFFGSSELKAYWFSDIENELNNVFDKSKNIIETKKIDKKTRKDSANWLIDRYNIFIAHKLVTFPKKTINYNNLTIKKVIILFSLFSLIPVLFFLGFNIFEQFQLTINIIVNLVLLFGLTLFIYSLYIGFCKTKSISSVFQLIIFNLIIIFLSSWFIIFDIDTLRNALFKTELMSYGMILPFILISVLSIFFIYSVERQERSSSLRRFSFLKALSLFLLSIIYIFAINIVGTSAFANEKMPQEYFLEKVWNETELLHIPDSIKLNDTLKIKTNRIEFIEHNTKRTWIDSVKNYVTYQQVLFVLDIIDSTELKCSRSSNFKFGNKEIDLTKKHNKKRYKDDILYEFLQNLNLPKTEQKVMYKVNFLGATFDIFPSMLLINTILALFIGIFVQLIINRKKLTEN